MSAVDAAPLLAVEDVRVRFGGLTAVDGASFAIPAGSIVSLIGPNGAGKTTLFNAITALHPPTSGTVRIAGREPRRRWDLRTALAILAAGLGLGAITQVLWSAQALWTTAVVDRYAYRAAFPWRDAAGAAWEYLVGLGPWPSLIGAAVGAAAALRAWHATRRAPDLVFHAGVARTFQNIRLFAGLSARENVQVALAAARRATGAGVIGALLRLPAFRRHEREDAAEADALLASVGLAAHRAARAGDLPYGLQRRLEIARALAAQPRLLLLDEPAAGMNPSESAELMTLIRGIRERGVTVLLIEHDMNVVMGISDRIVVLDRGRVIADGVPAAVRSDPKVIEAYLGAEVPPPPPERRDA